MPYDPSHEGPAFAWINDARHLRLGQSNRENSKVTYFDGLGRKLQVRSEAENGQVVVTEASLFNARQNASREFLPYYRTGMAYQAPDLNLPHVTQYYDSLGRVIRREHPDSSLTEMQYRPLAKVLLFDEEDTNPASPHHNTPQTLFYDGLERLIQVEEINIIDGQREHYMTKYGYDTLGNLTELVDAAGNVKQQRFDALSRKLSINDPDRGEVFFTHDDNGNIIKMIDSKEQHIEYIYDAANRITSINYVTALGDTTPEFIYHYDGDLSAEYPDATKTQGRFAWVTDSSDAEYLSYDDRGNLAGLVKRVRVPSTDDSIDFAMRMQYDAMQRLIKYTFPDGVEQTFQYNEQSFLEANPGYVNNIDYMSLGKQTQYEAANGVTTIYQYDRRQRLERLLVFRWSGWHKLPGLALSA